MWLALVLVLVQGCKSNIGVDRVTPRRAYGQVNASALNGTRLSAGTLTVLHRHSLLDDLREDTDRVIRQLHEIAVSDPRRDPLLALAELHFAEGEKSRRSANATRRARASGYYLACAAYAYWFLFLEEKREPPPTSYDRQFRLACDLYNRALIPALADGTSGRLRFDERRLDLPTGSLELSITRPGFPWQLSRFERFEAADNFAVRGVSVRIRDPGLGLPFIAVEKESVKQPFPRRAAATAFLRVQGEPKDLGGAGIRAQLELYSTYDEENVRVGEQVVPLETDNTSPLAYALEASPLWEIGLRQFFSAEQWVKNDVYLTQPYQPGKIPVIFVHGTASSPVWWAEMWNTLRSDPLLRKRFQFWAYLYNTGNPINHSAANLRESLLATIRKLDPRGEDESLNEAVVVGHSQGGLLAKMTVVDSGNALWNSMNKHPFDAARLKVKERELVEKRFFMKPLPFVKRVVFIATPHGGSYLARPWLAKLARTWVSFPAEVIRFGEALLKIRGEEGPPLELPSILPTSIDNMSPNHPLLQALARLDIAPGVHAHSIIAVKGEGDPEKGSDGVVEYRSAVLPGVPTRVVRASHSCQDKPETIEEMRRILVEHLRNVDARQE